MCSILDALNTPFETVNVLEDEGIRSGIKIYSRYMNIFRVANLIIFYESYFVTILYM